MWAEVWALSGGGGEGEAACGLVKKKMGKTCFWKDINMVSDVDSGMKRAVIRIRGNVQCGGYRDKVGRAAYEFNLNGYVQNMEDGSVEVVCEGEKKDIELFLKRIKIDKYPIRVVEASVQYSNPTGEFSYFNIIREKDLTNAVYDRMDAAAEYLSNIYEETKKVHEETKRVGEKVEENIAATKEVGTKVDTGFKELGTKVDAVGAKVEENIAATKEVGTKVDAVGTKVDDMHVDLAEKLDTSTDETRLFREETRGAFVELDTKYHVVSEALLSMNDSLKVTEAKMIESVDNLTRVVEEFFSTRRKDEK